MFQGDIEQDQTCCFDLRNWWLTGQSNNDFLKENMMQFLSKAYEQLNQILQDYARYIQVESKINKTYLKEKLEEKILNNRKGN